MKENKIQFFNEEKHRKKLDGRDAELLVMASLWHIVFSGVFVFSDVGYHFGV